MGATAKRPARARGNITALPSGSLRVRVYAGIDALTGKEHYLTEVVQAGPGAAKEAERVRTRLLSQVDEKRSPKTRATVNQMLDAYLDVLDVEPTTRTRYELDIRLRLRPTFGSRRLDQVEADVVERYYARLRRCRDCCEGRTRHVRHRTRKAHECDDKCVTVPCSPLSVSSLRSLHWVFNSAFDMAVRWRWISVNPLAAVEPPAAPTPQPRPPSLEEATRILDEASKDPDWSALVWMVMVTGMRRGELCALKRENLDLEAAVLTIAYSIKKVNKKWVRLGTKTHQQRRVAVGAETMIVLKELIARMDARAKKLGIELGRESYLFSLAPDASSFIIPDTVTQRYERMVARLGIDTTFHKLRHYNATELISAGVDIRTVAGRLGHGGGGTTTLKVYAAWVSEADHRAADLADGSLRRRRAPQPPA